MRPTLALAVLLPTSLAAVLGPNHDQAVLNSPHFDQADSSNDATLDQSIWHHAPYKHFDHLIDGAKDRGTKLRNKVLADIKKLGSKLESQLAEPDSTQTIWQQIHEHPETSKFAAQVAKYDDLVDILNGTDARHTLFVPINSAFEHLPKHKELNRDFILEVLKYHILPGDVSAKDALSSYTLPTLHAEKALGDEAQRLRPSFGLHGAKLNFYSTIVKVDVPASNGVIHGVDRILVPPPVVGLILTALPSRFSTLLLAYEKTDFVKFVHGQKLTGSTMFAPSNKAFKRLGPKINYFLFNTEKGQKYLLALLKYQIIPDITVYSDAVVDKRDSKRAFHTSEHRELHTLLDGAPMGVDTAKFLGLIFIRVNGFIDVAVHDGVAKNGVIHLVDQLPLPPRKRNAKGYLDAGDDITLEELKERLDDYL